MSGQGGYRPTSVLINLLPDVVEAIDIFVAIQPEPRPSREDMICYALRDWLTEHGLLPFVDGSDLTN